MPSSLSCHFYGPHFGRGALPVGVSIYHFHTLNLSHLHRSKISQKREGLVAARLSTNVRASFVFVMMYTIQKRIRCDVDGSIDSKVHPSTIDANHRGMNTHARPAIHPEMARWSLEKQKHHRGDENAFSDPIPNQVRRKPRLLWKSVGNFCKLDLMEKF